MGKKISLLSRRMAQTGLQLPTEDEVHRVAPSMVPFLRSLRRAAEGRCGSARQELERVKKSAAKLLARAESVTIKREYGEAQAMLLAMAGAAAEMAGALLADEKAMQQRARTAKGEGRG